MASNVSSVYIHVVDDVINKVREEFINYGAGEIVLRELQELWETKMMQCGVITGPIERPAIQKPGAPITPVHDLNVPYEGPTEEYETPTAEMLFPPTPMLTPLPQTPLPQTPLPGALEQPMYNIPTAPSDYAPSPITEIRNGIELKTGRPGAYLQPPSSWTGQKSLGVDVNVAYVEGREDGDRAISQQPSTQDFFMVSSGKRKRDNHASHLNPGGFMPQQDGSGDITIEFSMPKNLTTRIQNCSDRQEAEVSSIISKNEVKTNPELPQQDGVHDEYDNLFQFQGVATEDYNTPGDHDLRAPTPVVGTPKPSKTEVAEDDEPPLNEDDDDDDDLDDLEQGEDEPNTQHLVLAQFDKVTRTKNRWKCTLKDGIMHLNSRDILFNKANGEFEF